MLTDSRYQSENLALIRHIILGCHLDQLSNDGLLGYIEGDMLAAKEEKGYLDRRFYGTYVEQTLYVIWVRVLGVALAWGWKC